VRTTHRSVTTAFRAAGILALAVGVLPAAGSSTVLADNDHSHGRSRVDASLDGYEEVPSIATTGRGRFRAKINEREDTIDFVLTYSGLSGPANVAHIHFATRHVSGGVSVFLCGGGGKPMCPAEGVPVTGTIVPGDVATGTAAPRGLDTFEELVDAIRAGATYVNVHTTLWPGGEIRGQIDEGHDHK
jgi:hypothetical protein